MTTPHDTIDGNDQTEASFRPSLAAIVIIGLLFMGP